MPRIKQLSKHMINQIAAGEVIERPASVVKELTENSIDAGATKITIDISNDCRNIRIADNGCGIHPDDIELAFSKHATSKIQNENDLYDIHTLGFRGEALASIISISKLTCTTRTKDFDYGVKVTCQNSEVEYTNTGCAVGTIMDIKDLFYNIPARMKFLKTITTEFSYIQEIVQSIALSHPEVSIELKKFGKTSLKTTGQGDLLQTIKEVYNSEVTNNLKEVLKTDNISNLKISGFVSTPNYTRSSKKSYHIYINSRSVKCSVFQKAIDMVYKSLTAGNKYPLVVLNLEIPPSDIDVNVHPTKKEVRYKNANQVFNFIYCAIQAGLSNYVEKNEENNNPESIMRVLPSPKENDNIEFVDFRQNQDDVIIDRESDTVYFKELPQEPLTLIPQNENRNMQNNDDKKNYYSSHQQISLIKNEETSPLEEEEKIIGQYHDTYILIDTDEGLEIVDQHIAQERYIYEKLKTEKNIVSQLLFISDVINLSVTDVAILKEHLPKFEKFGYGIEFLNDKEVILRKIPQLLAKVSPQEIISDILDNIEGDIDNLEEKILITTSCKAAVKANTKLSFWQMQEIIKNWRKTKMPYTCPHGRTISKIIPHKELAAFFQRAK